MALSTNGVCFGVGAGRCGTMLLANLLNSEQGMLCVHEGKIRAGNEPQRQWLPFLTLENYMCYAKPEIAQKVFYDRRKVISEIIREQRLSAFADIAYNYAPFVRVMPAVFENAKLIILARDGRDFVRSVYTSDRPDPLPVGWLDSAVELTNLEKYVALGRLRPLADSDTYDRWRDMSPIQKNAWLWSETYRLILDGLTDWKKSNVLMVYAEDFFFDTKSTYSRIREFLSIQGELPEKTKELLSARVNRRSSNNSYVLPHYSQWSVDILDQFWSEAQPMMQRLGYV